MPDEVRYTPRQLQNMQQEAIRRVQEMQRRSQQAVGRRNNNSQNHPSPPTGGKTAGKAEGHPSDSQSRPPVSPSAPPPSTVSENPAALPALDKVITMENPLKGITQALHLDHDRILILLVLFSLLEEGADTTMLLALVYLML